MIKKVFGILYLGFSILFFGYLIFPNPNFPTPPPGDVQSKEPGDTESPLRRAYFTNDTREEVMQNYKQQFETSTFLNIKLPTYRLNYGPEEAQAIIRDQTRSTFLEEIVHPFRESVFVNGFEPKEAKDAVVVDTVAWRQKITVRYVPSNLFIRILIGFATLVLIVVLVREYFDVKK